MKTNHLPSTEWSETFLQGMLDRMAISFHKYGAVADAYPHKYDAIGSMRDRLQLYIRGDEKKGIKPGNTEYLMDAANFLMIEAMHPRHESAHFEGTDETGSPGRRNLDTGRSDHRHNMEESGGLWVPGAR